jgi:hypothetical protein
LAIETDKLIGLILGILVVVAVSIGVYLTFKNQIIDFFNGLSPGSEEEQNQQQTPTIIAAEKSGKFDKVGFILNNGIVNYDTNIAKPAGFTVMLTVVSEENCEETKYQIWQDNVISLEEFTLLVGDLKKSEKISLKELNIFLNVLTKGIYHVDCLCYNSQKRSTKMVSKKIEVK